MWVVQHWQIIGYCLLGWMILSVLLGIVAGRTIRKLGDGDRISAGFRGGFMPLSPSRANSRTSQRSVLPPSPAP